MKIKTFLVRSLTLAAGLCTASIIVNASSVATFSDSWKDTAVLDTTTTNYKAVTAGAFSVQISLGGVVSSNFDSNTMVMLMIGPAGKTPTTIFTNRLRDDPKYTSNATSATFPLGGTNGTVKVSWAATNITIAGSTKADLLSGEKTYSNSVSSNFFLGEISLIVDSSSNPHGAVFDYLNKNVPVVANNTTTAAAHTNHNGSTTALQAGSINGAADFTPPKVTITSPPANATFPFASPMVVLRGSASDKYGVASVQLSVDGGPPISVYQLPMNQTAFETIPVWTAPSVDLSKAGHLGSNLFTVIVFNTLGNSNSVSRNLFLLETNSAVVAVIPASSGTVKGIKNNQVLNQGFSYSVTATPANASWIFSKWTNGSGTVLSTAPMYNYVDTDGTLTAVFAPNPFYSTGLAGTYEALFFDGSPAKVGPTNSGYITVTVTAGGNYSGKLYLGESASPFPLSGQLAVAGANATGDSKVKVSKTEELDVQLQVAINPNLQSFGAGMLSGWVIATNNGTTWLWTEGIKEGGLVQFNPNIVPGLYNVFISPEANPAAGPGGFSVASVKVSKTGDAGLVLTLADGTSPATSFSTSLTLGGICPIYASLYGGKGVIIGSMQFTTSGSRTIASGPVIWDKMPVNDNFYTNGFSYTPTVVGGLYQSLNIFEWMVGKFDPDAGLTNVNLAADTGGVNVIFDPVKDTLVDTNKPNKVAITLNPFTGGLSGAFMASAFNLQSNTVALPSFQGVAIDDQGWGFYKATNQETGPILIKAPLD